MFSRNRSAQLLEQPLLSRFAPDLRRRTRTFAYKPHHKIHNTSPRRAITTEYIHRSREFMQNRSSVFKIKSFIVPPFSSLFQSCIGGASRSLCARSRNLRRHCNEEGDVRTGNYECAHQSSAEKKEEEAEEEECRGASSLFVRRNEEKPGAFAE